MRIFSITTLIVLLVAIGVTQAQWTRADVDRIRQRGIDQQSELQRELKTTCTMPDGSTHALSAVSRYEGQEYECVQVFRSDGVTLSAYAAGWLRTGRSN